MTLAEYLRTAPTDTFCLTLGEHEGQVAFRLTPDGSHEPAEFVLSAENENEVVCLTDDPEQAEPPTRRKRGGNA